MSIASPIAMFELPEWTHLLRNYYVSLRLCRRGSSLQRSYYRKVQKEKLRLAEEGVCQNKIKAACRFLASQACMRDYQSRGKDNLIVKLTEPQRQMVFSFCLSIKDI